MSWIEILKTKSAENVQDYWEYLKEITVAQDEEPNEGQISKAMKLADKYQFSRELQGHIGGLLSVKFAINSLATTQAEKALADRYEQELPQAIAELDKSKADTAAKQAEVDAMRERVATVKHNYHHWKAHGEMMVQDAKNRLPQVFN